MLLISSKAYFLYETDRFEVDLIDQIEFDCLHYYVRDFIRVKIPINHIVHQTIAYCIRPLSLSDLEPSFSAMSGNGQLISFDALKHLNVTSEQLYKDWFVSIDVAETYELFLHKMSVSKDYFYNCSSSYFGDRCQYQFNYVNDSEPFSQIVESVFSRKDPLKDRDSKNPLLISNLTCYVHLNCDRGPPPSCLDWREICDGKIDCLNEKIDEKNCFEIELTSCDGYRCHIGQCIPEKFFRDDPVNPDCLDRLDEPTSEDQTRTCVTYPGFRCEESKSSHPSYETCGDGSDESMKINLKGYYTCENSRSILLRNALVFERPTNISETCWLNMWCPHHFSLAIFDSHWIKQCENKSYWFIDYKQRCPIMFFFPARPIFFGHVRFAYLRETYRGKEMGFLPDYICYDEHLCDGFTWTPIYIDGQACIHDDAFLYVSRSDWMYFIDEFYDRFKVCLPYSSINRLNSTHCDDDRLYPCENSLKCISKHRLMDGFIDCVQGDDEANVNISCFLPDAKYRYRCKDEPNKCISPIQLQDGIANCPSADDEIDPNKITIRDSPPFSKLCDEYLDIKPIRSSNDSETDETHCEEWPCDNIYTRCNHFWNCPNGFDESQCVNSSCPFHTYPCLSPLNNKFSCLPFDKVNDGQIDCRGGTDERYFCRTITGEKVSYLQRFSMQAFHFICDIAFFLMKKFDL